MNPARTLWESALASGGVTIDAQGHTFTGTGFAVGGRVPSLTLPLWYRLIPDTAVRRIADWLRANPAPFYGAWVDGQEVFIDATDIVPQEQDALRLGAQRGERAIYDFATSREVRL